MVELATLRAALRAVADPAKAAVLPTFFKAGPGQYGEGDQFLGVSVPEQRVIAKQYPALSLPELDELLQSPWHEERATGIFILVSQFQHGDASLRQPIYDFYLAHSNRVNNWDLVDASAPYIVGPWLDGHPEKQTVLQGLAHSKLLWDRRIAMLATFAYIKQGQAEDALLVADTLLSDDHDLIQKAIGWMLREVGKRVDQAILADYLKKHAATMPRTTLRYAIEHFTPARRQIYLQLKNGSKV